MRIARAALLASLLACPAAAEWKVVPAGDQRQPSPPRDLPADAQAIKPGDKWPNDQKFRWLLAELPIPEAIEGKPTAGQPVGMRLSCGDGGEVWGDGRLQVRYDNDHPALALLAENARPGQKVKLAVQVYGKVQGGDSFSEANWVLIDPRRVREPLAITVNPQRALGPVPDGLVGLSQGGGLADYDDATAAKLRDAGFRWFRMDNVLTNAMKKADGGGLTYDWTDLDRRVDFIVGKMRADAILAVSYMPQVLDAVPDGERHSAPRDYGVWEELCFQAAKRCLDRGRRVAFWEVWNEVNSGWVKPGPGDTGAEPFKKLYAQAIGKEPTDQEVVRRFEAYCKLYAATARGVRRADPKAKVGGPALASGPFEQGDKDGPGVNGKGFARGLMLWCQQQHLPLDFVSWHEYFQPPDIVAREADAFRRYLADFPDLQKTVASFMITEWNTAWWADRPQDHELGAAWCANQIIRAFLPAGIDRPCFFYVKQNDMNFRGDYSLLMQDNVPKPVYNALKIFNRLRGRWVEVKGGDGEVAAVAAFDPRERHLSIVLVNFNDRYGLRRHVRVQLADLPRELRNAAWSESVVDATHSNIWNDPNDRKKAELTEVSSGESGFIQLERTLMPNSVTTIELHGAPAKR